MSSTNTNDKLKIKNHLDPCDRSNNHDLQVWLKNSGSPIILKPGQEGELKFDRGAGDLIIYIKTTTIPSKRGVRGVKIIPGWYPGVFHHIDTVLKGNELFSILYYDPSEIREEDDVTHRDPTVIHPDAP